MFAIIIPFYQAKPGVLVRALESIVAQTEKNWQIIIVDDESPVSAEGEVSLFPADILKRIHITKTNNGGPGKARNVGLDVACSLPDIDKIAFLDSDDRWDTHHLERANLALNRGDIYFCDYAWPGAATTRFRQMKFNEMEFSESIGDGMIRKLDEDFPELILGCWPVCISALCIRKSVFSGVRFDDRFKYSSEDQFYFLKLASLTDNVFYDCYCGLYLDEGMKFYSDRKRGQLKYTRSCITNLLFHFVVEKELKLSLRAQRINRRHMIKNIIEIFISEAKSMIREHVLHTDLYPELVRVLFYGLRPL